MCRKDRECGSLGDVARAARTTDEAPVCDRKSVFKKDGRTARHI